MRHMAGMRSLSTYTEMPAQGVRASRMTSRLDRWSPSQLVWADGGVMPLQQQVKDTRRES